MKINLLILISSFGLLSACQLSAQEAALLVINTEQNDIKLVQNAISKMLNGSDITLADNAFTIQSEVIIERRRNPAAGTSKSLGRDYSKPDHFKLWISKDSCLLEHVETGETEHLDAVQCVPAESKN